MTIMPNEAAFTSPSLVTPGLDDRPAFELKFSLDQDRAAQVEAWAHGRLLPDPHGDPDQGGSYSILSLYWDTPQLDVYHGSPGYRRHKYRVRRYGTLDLAFLERKSKWGDRVEKWRVAVPEDELDRLVEADGAEGWPGHWFRRQVHGASLGPVCRIAYRRTAFVGTCPESPLRLTLDRHAFGVPAAGLSAGPGAAGRPLLGDKAILELKFRAGLPAPFKALVAGLRLAPSRVSKYRLCQETWGVVRRPRGAADA